ncbi:MAG TPA: LuxR C-terminal-related transcriptional regulator, partial [Paracoccus sp. (in: a-proteobacteria)]|nr:LuxR C-terminal-related transcriptional regulator [Paracoccus sp. (in: a-proteobacteria)]
EVARLVARGLPNKRVARELDISEKTVHIHRQHVMEKAGVTSAAELARLMLQASPDAPPNGSAKITASGLDKIEAALNTAPPEQGQQPLMMLQMAKMLGKAGASGEMVWEIDATDPNGAILVNGQQVAGGTPPQQ